MRLKSANAREPIAIHANYLGDAEGYDLKMMVEARAHVAPRSSPSRRSIPIAAPRSIPVRDIDDERGIEAFVRRKAETVYHPVGTCRMGSDDEAVVDSELRVRGLHGLRVVDASVMPDLPSGNTNAPTIMIAERAADLILGKA